MQARGNIVLGQEVGIQPRPKGCFGAEESPLGETAQGWWVGEKSRERPQGMADLRASGPGGLRVACVSHFQRSLVWSRFLFISLFYLYF